MKKVLFDITGTQPKLRAGTFDGATNYAIAVLERLLTEENLKISLVALKDKGLDKELEKRISGRNIKIYEIENIEEVNNIIEKEEIDTFFTPLADREIFINRTKAKYIGTIHDMWKFQLTEENFKYQLLYFSKYTVIKKYIKNFIKVILKRKTKENMRIEYEKLIDNMDCIITDSEYSKASIIKEFSNSEKIEVLYPALSKEFKLEENYEKKIEEIEESYKIKNKKFFLLISGNRITKNNHRAIYQLDKFFDKNNSSEYKIVVTGAKNNKKYTLKNREKFVFLDYVETEELILLYKMAFCFVYPTMFEGFGYPPLEAMKYGTPIISSTTSSITQIYGESLLYFNPLIENEILTRIVQIVYDKEVRDNQIVKIEEKYKEISKRQSEDMNKLVKILNS